MDPKDKALKITQFYEKNKRMPSYSEIMRVLGYKSKNAAYRLVQKLISEGIVSKDNKGKLSPGESFFGIPMLGLVEAGFPTHVEEDRGDLVTLDEYLIDNKESSYLLRVKGDSMIDAGIREGDLVVADRSKSPRVGDIVIAEVDGAWTMKYYRKQGSYGYLEPANKKYKPIFPKETLKVAAVVRGVVRKYGT